MSLGNPGVIGELVGCFGELGDEFGELDGCFGELGDEFGEPGGYWGTRR